MSNASPALRGEEGQGLLELLISMVILAVGVGALLSVMAAGASPSSGRSRRELP